jgi:hypothetical protein
LVERFQLFELPLKAANFAILFCRMLILRRDPLLLLLHLIEQQRGKFDCSLQSASERTQYFFYAVASLSQPSSRSGAHGSLHMTSVTAGR